VTTHLLLGLLLTAGVFVGMLFFLELGRRKFPYGEDRAHARIGDLQGLGSSEPA
jgi:hypothetical protein